MKKHGFWAIVLVMLLFCTGCGAKPEGTEPTEFRVACFECKEKFAAGQLNTDFGLCQDCMIKVGAAYCQSCSAPCYTRDMVRGLCATCNTALEETTVEPETTVAVDMVNCNLCGRPIASSESKGGYCSGCRAQSDYHEDERNFATCDYCGVTYGYTDPLIGGACTSCWEGFAGLCETCGRPYRDGDGFESLCYSCQDKYGPKCSVCGTDLTYRGGIDGMCDDCYEAANRCLKCGSDITYQNFDGYCYYCHPSFGYTCVICGYQQPAHRPADGICDNCKCERCGAVLATPGGINGFCDACDAEIRVCFVCGTYPSYKEGYCYYCYPSYTYTCAKCGEQYVAYSESGLCPQCEQ